ncbi:alpha/beta hydrolase [Collibacillus ludicampi]|jgi:3-oxoadipate enol-lactonase|uniref:Alpha/beta hydrolase n=1 Tax=Collibacillus ludicampi TaxID=2771369 RepID=A0AAV4LBT4_9BACL|nr:alpha/beta hydrolase [Collibacillus ludicampi]GIM45161.1 alpha/beta hydrolase [Collibacillus ludicampi]
MEFITSDGAKLYYRREGQGEPLLFIHGLASNLQSWNYQLRYFRNFYDTLAYDCRGHGRSTIPRTLDMSDHSRDAYELCSLFDQPVTVVGISMGGYIAQRLLIEHPQVVKRAVLIATKSHGEKPATAAADDHTENIENPKEARFRFMRDYIFGPDTSDEKVAELVRLEPTMPEEQFDLVKNAIGAFDHRPQLAACTQPVLVLHGDHDRLIPPSYGEELAHLLPNATFVMIERGGHALMIEKHQEVNEAIHHWLKRVSVE